MIEVLTSIRVQNFSSGVQNFNLAFGLGVERLIANRGATGRVQLIAWFTSEPR